MLCLSIIFLACLVSVVFSEVLIASISRHTRLLVQKMQAFNVDEMTLPPASYDYSRRNDEFGLLNRQFDHMAERIKNLVQVNYINELWKKDAQLKALEMQINPHFLYNTLESINWRAKACGASDISGMVESLGSLLRASLSKGNLPWTLEQEIAAVNSYISIQKYRFDGRLEFSAVLEDIYRRIEVKIFRSSEKKVLHICVSNNGSQFEDELLSRLRSSAAPSHGFGIGLINIDERIRLMFGAPYGLFLYNEEDRAVALIDLPLQDTEVTVC